MNPTADLTTATPPVPHTFGFWPHGNHLQGVKMHYETRIDWETAKVESVKDGFQLDVELRPKPPDDLWGRAFQKAVETGTGVVGSLIKRVTLQTDMISAFGFKRGDENQVRDELEQTVERANADANRRRQETIDAEETSKQAEDQRVIDAEEMTRIFRTKN